MALRIIFSIALFMSILFLPFWASIILAILGMFLFTAFWEAVFLFFISDLIFGIKETRFFNIVFVSAILTLIFLGIVEFLKRKLKFYEKK